MCYYFCFSSFRSTVICHHYHHWKIAQEISRISCRISCTEREGKRNRESIGAHGTPLCPLKCLGCLFLLLLLFPIIYLTVLLFEREPKEPKRRPNRPPQTYLSRFIFVAAFPPPFSFSWNGCFQSFSSTILVQENSLPLSLSHLVVNLSISISAAVTKSRREGKGKKWERTSVHDLYLIGFMLCRIPSLCFTFRGVSSHTELNSSSSSF